MASAPRAASRECDRPQDWGNVYVYAEFKDNGNPVAYRSKLAGTY
jgi:hypothetical protein